MGNRQGSQKTKETKSKEEKKREKEIRKEEEKRRKKKEKERKKKPRDGAARGSGVGSEWEESSQVTESESSVFHSAENVAASPYLDSCTRSELEQLPLDALPGGAYLPRWGPASSVSAYQLHYQQYHQRHLDQQHAQLAQSPRQHQHPMVLSSKDFKDGFSLEACIPPEIARRDTRDSMMDDTATLVRAEGSVAMCEGSVKSKRSNASESNKSKASSKSSQFASPLPYHMTLTSQPGDDSASMTSSQTSAGGGAAGYSTPLLATPVSGRIERPHSPVSLSSASSARFAAATAGGGQTRDMTSPHSPHHMTSQQSPKSPHSPQSPHHPHFFNHQRNMSPQHHYQAHEEEFIQQHQTQTAQQICPIYQDISPLLIQQHQHQQHYHQLQTNHHQQHQPQHQRPYNIVDEDTLIRKQQIQNTHQQQQIQAFQQHPDIMDYRNLPKPASPHPTRRAFSPKMTSPAFKLISSDESSSSPTTPVPQRRAGAANILNLFRSSSKKDKNGKKSQERLAVSGKAAEVGEKARKPDSGPDSDGDKSKVKHKWKTWERSSSKKSSSSSNKTIFGTVRKGERTKSTSSTERHSDVVPSDYRVNDQKFEEFINNKEGRVNTAGCRKMTLEELRRDSHNRVADRRSSPPMVKSPALCIMKLEELERNIENTIREKFPDAEPFLLKKRTKDEELKGSRSLPTTPSLKKKLYVNRDSDGGNSNQLLTEDDVTSSLNAVRSKLTSEVTTPSPHPAAQYESLPSPAMSPVVLRRFGARTRHASISPKIQRAKTAALYNSPLEMTRVQGLQHGPAIREVHAPATRAVTKLAIYHAVSTEQPKSPPMMSAQCVATPPFSQCVAPLTSAHKSQSKYDNVDDSDDDVFQPPTEHRHGSLPHDTHHYGNHHHGNHQHGVPHHRDHQQVTQQTPRHRAGESYDSDEVDDVTGHPRGDVTDLHKPVIVPTFSAVFGSISPKLKRHLQEKFNQVSKDKHRGRNVSGDDACAHRQYIFDSSSKSPSPMPKINKDCRDCSTTQKPISAQSQAPHSHDKQHSPSQSNLYDNQHSTSRSPSLSKSPENRRSVPKKISRNNSSEKVSVKERIKSINRTLSEESAAVTGFPTSSPKTSPPVLQDLGAPALTRMTSHPASPVPERPDSRVPVADTPPLSPRQVGSPDSPRKHSSEHVVFGCAVALPCRRIAHHLPLSGGEELHENNNSRAHAQQHPSHPSPPGEERRHRCINGKKLEPGGNPDTPAINSLKPEQFLSDTRVSGQLATEEATTNLDLSVPYDLYPDVVKTSNSCLLNKPTVRVTDDVRSNHKSDGDTGHSTVGIPQVADFSEHHEKSISDDTGDHIRECDQLFKNNSVGDEQRNHGNICHDDSETLVEETQPFVIRRLPLSQVICDIINTGSQLEPPARSEVDCRGLEPPASGQRAVEQSDNMVKSTSYEEASINISDHRMQGECSVSLPASPTLRRIDRDVHRGTQEKTFSNSAVHDKPAHSNSGSPVKLTPFSSRSLDNTSSDSGNIMSRSAGSQTDSFTTAEKGVESADLDVYSQGQQDEKSIDSGDLAPYPDETERSPCRDLEEKQDDDWSEIKDISEPRPALPAESDDETRFLRNVLAFKRTDIPQKQTDVLSAASSDKDTFMPPPSSPSAMNQLIEEFEEEDEDDEIQERKEIELAMQKESEIREFTDKIYKRLSDLLGSQSGDGDDVDNESEQDDEDVVVDEMTQVLSKLENNSEFIERSEGSELSEEDDCIIEKRKESPGQFGSRAIVISSKSPRSNRLKKVLTIKSSSSSITTTSSSSEDEEEANSIALRNMMLQKMSYTEDQLEVSRCSERVDIDVQNLYLQSREGGVHQRCPSSSREYHSDDDVARGQGLPDYYDDKSLWRRNQKPPGQLSLDMAAARRSERRERWLKKRRRNKTDIVDNQRTENHSFSSAREPTRQRNRRPDEVDWREDNTKRYSDDFGTEIMSSPKYAKPILPFLSDIRSIRCEDNEIAEEMIEATVMSRPLYGAVPSSLREYDDDDNNDAYRNDTRKQQHRLQGGGSERDYDYNYDRREDTDRVLGSGKDRHEVMSDPDLEIPGIEETFNELMSVQNILEEMSDRPIDDSRPTKCLPLTQENVRSMRDYYKDKYSSGNGRHSRMSNTDRTESDLDIFSDPPDDASSDSNRYADDEDDDDCIDPYATADYATADDDTGDARRKHRRPASTDEIDDDDDDAQASYVVGCTFYNSKAFPASSGSGSADVMEEIAQPQCATTMATTPPVIDSPVCVSTMSAVSTMSPPTVSTTTSSTLTTPSTLLTGMTSDEEFWAGSAGFELSYRQLESAADAVSDTFHAAREQMMDIQQHLQELRRQMEDLQDDERPGDGVSE